MNQNDWNEEENFNLALSQRTEELYRIPNREPGPDGIIEAAVLRLRDLVIFPHMVSPVFLSEEEALQVIREELATHGVMLGPGEYAHGRALETGKFELSGVPVGWMGQEPFKADAADRQKRVAIEFISQRECEDLDRAQQRENSKDGVSVKSGQECLSGQHEPRIAHTAQRHHWVYPHCTP